MAKPNCTTTEPPPQGALVIWCRDLRKSDFRIQAETKKEKIFQKSALNQKGLYQDIANKGLNFSNKPFIFIDLSRPCQVTVPKGLT